MNLEEILYVASPTGLFYRGHLITVLVKIADSLSEEESEDSILSTVQSMHSDKIVPFCNKLKSSWRVERLYNS
jgi:hypothetical protein